MRNSIESLVDSILRQQQWDLGHDSGGIDHRNDPPASSAHRPRRSPKPYTLLVPHTQSFMARYEHSNSYRPHSLQLQPWILQSGDLWLEYIANLLLQHSFTHPHAPSSKLAPEQAAAATNVSSLTSYTRHSKPHETTASENNNRILFLTTLPSTSKCTTNVLQRQYGTNRVQRISCNCLGSFIDLESDDERNPPLQPADYDLERLDTIVTAVTNLISSSTSPISAIFIDSITPILMRHGYMKMIHFLQQLIDVCHHSSTRNILFVVPIRVEMFTSDHHSILANAIGWDAILNTVPELPHKMTLSRTEGQHSALLIRRGVQPERRDYIRRDILPYHVVVVVNDDCHLEDTASSSLVNHALPSSVPRRRYRIDCCCEIDSVPDNSHAPTTTESDHMNIHASKMSSLSITSTSAQSSAPSQTLIPSSVGVTKAVPLQLDDGTRRHIPPPVTTSAHITINTPNIYFEANDPDLYDNDYDEDEPDDDLDL